MEEKGQKKKIYIKNPDLAKAKNELNIPETHSHNLPLTLNPTSTKIGSNIMDIVFAETVRLKRKAVDNSNGLSKDETFQLAKYADIIYNFMTLQLKMKELDDLKDMNPEDFELLVKEAKEYLEKRQK